MSRLKDRYQKEVAPALKKEFGYSNVMAIPRLRKIVVNMGLGEATANAKLTDVGADEIGRITGQKAVVRRATKSIAQFKLRQGMPVGAMVTLRGERMYEFLDRLISVTLPRVRDFRGVNEKAFDGRGNYNMGLTEQSVFPEVNLDKLEFTQGMNITMVVRNSTNDQSREMLRLFGMPFRDREQGNRDRRAG
jgi:large subunit ribosomal protein L5